MQGCCICRAESEVGRDVGVNDQVDGASFVDGEKVPGMREIVPLSRSPSSASDASADFDASRKVYS